MKYALILGILVMAATASAVDIPVLGSDAPVSITDIAGTPTMITVILKDSEARDTNLKLIEVRPDRITVLAPNGDLIPYLVESVQAVELQDGAVEVRHRPEMDTQVLRAEHQRVVDRAWVRIQNIYNETSDDQELRMQAAMMLAMTNDSDAHNYLRQLAESNDILIQLDAAGALFLIGDNISESLLRQGMESGNRNARAQAASLAGLSGYSDGIQFLKPLARDRAVQLSAPAMRALARLRDRSMVDQALSMINDLHQEKGEAAIFTLSALGDEHVIETLKFRLLEADGIVRFRMARVLYNLDDPRGLDELKFIYDHYPTLAPEVALILASEGDWDATQFLRNRLARREDPTEANLRYRARNAQALLEGGDPSAMAVFQELLRSDDETITRFTFKLMVELGLPRLITLLQPAVENIDKEYSLNACQTVIAMALPDFRERLLLYRSEFSD